jgi:light-regulated signal transduction histidine kinase (bacteriophytochrome)
MNNNTLWGLIVCHYKKARKIPVCYRFAILLLSKLIGRELISIDKIIQSNAAAAIFYGVQQMKNIIYNGKSISDAFIKINKDLLKLFSADGFAYFYNEKISIVGLTPKEEQIKKLIKWLTAHHNIEPFVTHTLHQDYPPSIHLVGY